jgi:hypothetical protein
MPIAKGASKSVAYKKETSFGTLAGSSGAKLLRRVTASFNLSKEQYESGEIRVDRQTSDARHGVRSAAGSINGELSPASYADFMQSLVARDFTVKTATTGLSITIATSGSLYTVTRATGSWITDAYQVGMVVRLTGAGFNVGNVNKNLLIVSVGSATVMTVLVLNGSTLTAEGPIASATVTMVGKNTFVPASGHTDDSYTVEEFYSDVPQSEVYTGLKVTSMNVSLPASGLTTVDFSLVGKDLTQSGATQYFTSPTAQNTNGIFAAVNGAMIVNGAPVALITSADFSVNRATENATAVGSNSVAEIFTGRITATGNLSVYFQDGVFRDYFNNETEVSLVMGLTTNNTATADFVTFTLPRVKLGSFEKTDGELGITASSSFTALLNSNTASGLPATTVAIQDSLA